MRIEADTLISGNKNEHNERVAFDQGINYGKKACSRNLFDEEGSEDNYMDEYRYDKNKVGFKLKDYISPRMVGKLQKFSFE